MVKCQIMHMICFEIIFAITLDFESALKLLSTILSCCDGDDEDVVDHDDQNHVVDHIDDHHYDQMIMTQRQWQ